MSIEAITFVLLGALLIVCTEMRIRYWKMFAAEYEALFERSLEQYERMVKISDDWKDLFHRSEQERNGRE